MQKDNLPLKEALQNLMFDQIELQMASFRKAKASIEESKLNETKSSAGDKYETGRAMMQREQDKIESQLGQLSVTKNQLKLISPELECDEGGTGALVLTDNGNFYITVSLGKITFEGLSYYTISPEAPLSKLLVGKKVGEQIKFRDRSFEILDIQ